jgi:small subunit ribosomal protein S6
VDDGLEATFNKINQMITERGGIVSSQDQWGKRKLAYPIDHFKEGNYVLIKLRLEPAQCQKLEASLRISEEILRYLLIKVE